MTYIVAGGTGFIGRYLIPRWLSQGKKILVIGRDAQKIHEVFSTRVESLPWKDVKTQGPEIFSKSDFLLNLAGSNIAQQRWTKNYKEDLLKSRVETTELLSEICASLGSQSPPFFSADGVGIYGLQENAPTLPPALTEDSPIHFHEHSPFISEIGGRWEKATELAKNHGVPVVNFRLGMVLGKKGGPLQKMQLPFQLGLGGPVGSGDQPYSWIHIEDVARALDFMLSHLNHFLGAVNLVSPHCVSQRLFAKTFGEVLHRPAILPLPAFVTKILLGAPMAEELLLHGQHVYPKRLLEGGFTFKYADLKEALKEIYGK